LTVIVKPGKLVEPELRSTKNVSRELGVFADIGTSRFVVEAIVFVTKKNARTRRIILGEITRALFRYIFGSCLNFIIIEPVQVLLTYQVLSLVAHIGLWCYHEKALLLL
jgi:hypothetical protein